MGICEDFAKNGSSLILRILCGAAMGNDDVQSKREIRTCTESFEVSGECSIEDYGSP